MTRDDLILTTIDSIKQYGTDTNKNKFLKVLSQLNGNKDFLKYADRNKLTLYYKYLNDGDIIPFEHPDPLKVQDFWQNKDGFDSWLYTVKILPMAEKNFSSEVYDTIFNGSKILPAGLDKESKQDPNKNTIWNVVERNDTDRVEVKNQQKKTTNNQTNARSFLRQSETERPSYVKSGLAKLGDKSLNDTQLKNVADFITNLLKS